MCGFAQTPHELDSLRTLLETVYRNDQQPRLELQKTMDQYSRNSAQVTAAWPGVIHLDSINQGIVKSVIDKYGWLSARQTSSNANSALFLTIQHANLEMQVKYLPVLKAAIADGKADPQNYALLADRINMFQNHYQIYGTQISGDYQGNLCFWPIENEPEVDKRRLKIGLDSIKKYAKYFDITYQSPAIDSLKDNIIIKGYITDKDRNGIAGVKLYSGKKLIAQANADGAFRLIISRKILDSELVLKKTGYKDFLYHFKNTDWDVYEIHPVIAKL